MADYTSFYHFSEDPFKNSPNPKFFFPSESHNEALMSLQYGINERKGFILLLGEKGIGKTTLLNHLISTSDAKVKIAFIPHSRIPYKKLLKEILYQLDVPLKFNVKGSMLHELYYHLIKCLEHDENVAIILDEAHQINESVVEEVRLLANLETSTSKLLQIVLCGEPELRDKLRADVIRQIGQRIVITSRIEPMTEEESLQYIDHRLKIVGSSSSQIFTDEALTAICKQAGGVPRAINILCDNALSVGCSLAEEKISAATVRKIRKEKGLIKDKTRIIRTSRVQSRLPIKILAAFVLLMALAAVIFFNKDHVKNILNRYDIIKSAEQASLVKDAKKKAMSESTLKTPISEVVNTPTKHEQPLSPPPAPVKQPDKEIRVKTIVAATVGINLSSLARKNYKLANATLIDHILELNPDIKNPDLILVNQKIKLPEISDALLIKPSPDGGFKVHLATFTNRSSAAQYSGNIAIRGKQIEIAPRQVSARETWYRVMAGPFANWDEASKTVSEMKQRGIILSFRE